MPRKPVTQLAYGYLKQSHGGAAKAIKSWMRYRQECRDGLRVAAWSEADLADFIAKAEREERMYRTELDRRAAKVFA